MMSTCLLVNRVQGYKRTSLIYHITIDVGNQKIGALRTTLGTESESGALLVCVISEDALVFFHS